MNKRKEKVKEKAFQKNQIFSLLLRSLDGDGSHIFNSLPFYVISLHTFFPESHFLFPLIPGCIFCLNHRHRVERPSSAAMFEKELASVCMFSENLKLFLQSGCSSLEQEHSKFKQERVRGMQSHKQRAMCIGLNKAIWLHFSCWRLLSLKAQLEGLLLCSCACLVFIACTPFSLTLHTKCQPIFRSKQQQAVRIYVNKNGRKERISSDSAWLPVSEW